MRYPGTREVVILVVELPPIETDLIPAPGLLAAGANSERRRDELADFLRKRRAALQPEEVGLPGGGRRRTPGLRREEVAHLAGVGTTWYTWLEQGRDVRASLEVLEAAVPRAAPDPRRAHPPRAARPRRGAAAVQVRGARVRRPCGARSRTSATTRRSCSAAAGTTWPGTTPRWRCSATSGAVPRPSRNHVWMHFMDPARREMFPDWTRVDPHRRRQVPRRQRPPHRRPRVRAADRHPAPVQP